MKKNVDHFLLLNDWIKSLQLLIKIVNFRPILYTCKEVPQVRYIYGLVKKWTTDMPALVPVTDNMYVILEVLGFDNPQAILEKLLLGSDVTQHKVCSLLCSSRHFSPDMVQNTNYAKFGGMSPLAHYVFEKYGRIGDHNKSNTAAIDKGQRRIHRAITQRFPHVLTQQLASEEQSHVLSEVYVATWGCGLEDGQETNEKVHYDHDRWCRFVQLHGLLTLSKMAPDEAYNLWTKFRDEPLAHAYDWQCLREIQIDR